MNRTGFLFCLIFAIGCFKARVDTLPGELILKLKANTTPEAAREWVMRTAAERLKGTNSITLPKEFWPAWINALTNREPMRVVLERTNNEASAFIIWNFARGLYGIDLHTSTNALPKQDDLFHSEMWTPGIYAWHARGD